MEDIESKPFISRLQLFAESFTGYPVRIIVPSQIESKNEIIQVQDFLKVYVPRSIKSKNAENAFNYFKGLVSLQSSAVLYKGIAEAKEISSKFAFSSLEDFIMEGELGGLTPLTYQTIELARRVQCLSQDYKLLGEDIKDGFRGAFRADFLTNSANDSFLSISTTNEIDLALTSEYWRAFGIENEKLSLIKDKILRDHTFGIFREEIETVLRKLINFENPLNSSYNDIIQRTKIFVKYIDDLCQDIDISFISRKKTFARVAFENMELSKLELLAKSQSKNNLEDFKLSQIKKISDRIEKLKSMVQNYYEQLESKVDLEKRLSLLSKRKSALESIKDIETDRFIKSESMGAELYSDSKGSSKIFRDVFSEVPLLNLVSLEIPESLKQEQNATKYLPELREGVLCQKVVRVNVYDLNKNQPITEKQMIFQLGIEQKISKLNEEMEGCNRKIHSDINYIYEELPEIVKKRDKLKREIDRLKNRLSKSNEVHESLAKKDLEVDSALIKRIEREMESIRPSARKLVRNCFEGELDEKKFYDWLIDMKLGGNKIPNFYYQWQRRRRDVASVLLIDASQSTERIASENKSFLDLLKESAYYFCLASQFLEDRCAVFAYNGRGERNSRMFLLKDFSEDQRNLYERLRLLRGELNNRDGSAIRFATESILGISSKTKFLFHLSDMKPSDLEFEYDTPQVRTYRYEGEKALEDVTNAFDFAKASGIIPVGVCFRPEKENNILNLGKKEERDVNINLKVLKKLKDKKKLLESDELSFDERLRRNFGRNYKVIKTPLELPKALRDVYVRLSFL